MNATNPEIESQLDELAELCCQQLKGDPAVSSDEDRSEPLLKSLLMSGFARKGERSLQTEIENRVKDKCRDEAMHRGGALSSITGQLESQFKELAQWESKQVKDQSESKPANISSATDA